MPPIPPLPPYEDDNVDLSQLLADLRITVPSPAATEPPPYQTSVPSPATPTTLYIYSTPTEPALPHTEAAAESQGVPGGSALRITPQRQKKRRPQYHGYAVFCGLATGTFHDWETVEPFVKNVSNCLFKGYRTFAHAEAAYEYARARGWTRILSSTPAPSRALKTPSNRHPQLPTPIGLGDVVESINPLHGDTPEASWHVVYCGITPGVYQSSLECSLNTRGLSCASYDSCTSKEDAIARFQDAVAHGRVKALYHIYH
ncbi:hypothetical protein B0H13DRAFT_1888085 [Mycena leptocephala]|nr:hypothetical protein B0H13DRAFT_1888085 [Mycena leptocephala]